MSDGVLKVDDRYKFEDDVIREIYERKDKALRKGNNISVTTNTSTTTASANMKKCNGGFSSNLTAQQAHRKSTGGSKNPSVVSDKSEIYSSPAHAQQTLGKIQT